MFQNHVFLKTRSSSLDHSKLLFVRRYKRSFKAHLWSVFFQFLIKMKISKAVLAGLVSLDEAANVRKARSQPITMPPAPQSFLEAC